MDHEQAPQATTSVPPVPVAHSQTDAVTAFRPEGVQILASGSRDSEGAEAGRDTRPQSSSTEQRLLGTSSEGQHTYSHENPLADFERVPIPPPRTRSRDMHARTPSNRLGLASQAGLPPIPRDGHGLDWIVPVNEKDHTRRTLGDRIGPTIENAQKERDKYAQKALWTGYALNIAIGLQVLLGALTTGIAAAVPSGKQAQVSTSILGGLSTLVASYLARARGSGEPELSVMRVKDLDEFLRECRAFELDHAHEYGSRENGFEERLVNLRWRFEELLGNANGQRKLSPVGITATRAAP